MFISYRRDLSTRVADTVVALALIATAFVVGAPILAGGWLTYLDNPAHLAELHSLATEGTGGWSNIGFAGISLDTLHSPPFWRGLALLHGSALMVPAYASLVCLAIAAPALAIYAVARRRMAVVPAAALAYVVLIQRGVLVGSASATGGMWTFYLAAAAWILLADQLARPERNVAAVAALLGFIALVHLYVLEAAVMLLLVHAAWNVARRQWRALGRDAVSCGLAAAAASVYWVPVIVAGGVGFREPQNLAIGQLAQLLVLPTDTIELLSGVPMARLPAAIESIPMVVLLAAGTAGLVRWRHRRDDVLPAIGGAIAVLVTVLLVIAPVLDLRVLGPNSWRFLYFIRLGAALAALPLAARLSVRISRIAAGVVCAAMVASGLVWGLPLREEVPDANGSEMSEVRALWAWLAANARGERVYMQDTFFSPPVARTLSRSHVLALTLFESGVEPLGPYYGIVPAATAMATSSEFGVLFGGTVRDPDTLRLALAAWGTKRFVTASPRRQAALEHTGFRRLAQIGRFAVLEPATSEPLFPRGTREGSNRLVFDLDQPAVVAVGYHPFWTVVEGAAQLGEDPTGRLAIAGSGHIVLEYDPPLVWPASIAGWLGIAALWTRRRKRN